METFILSLFAMQGLLVLGSIYQGFMLFAEEVPEAVKNWYSKLGKKGKGKSKVRGDAEYYKNLVRIREEKRKIKNSEEK